MKLFWPTVATAVLLAAPAHVSALNDAGPALPPVETVLQRVAEKSAKADENEQAFQERYFFTRTRVTEYRNSKGEVKKREEKKRENNPLQKTRAARPQSSGAKLPPTVGTKTNEAVSETHSNVRGKAFEKSDFSRTATCSGVLNLRWPGAKC